MNEDTMLNRLLDSDSHLITKAEHQMLDIWDLKDVPLNGEERTKLIELYDRVFVYGCE